MIRKLVPALAVLAVAGLAACTTSEKVATPASGAMAHAVDCAGASLALPEATVVGKLDGKPITVKDLGADAAAAERKALYEYCDAVHATRAQALDGYVTEQLVQKAAAAAGKTADEWVQGEMQKRIAEPSEEEIKAFYDANTRPGAPPLEEIRGQVVMVMQREKSEQAVREILEGLKKGVAVERSLPDVRSPARDVGVAAHTATKGGSKEKGARVQVVEFADFQCPYCTVAAKTVKELHAKYGDKVEFAYRHFPLRSIHPDAQRAAELAQCSKEQGKFWEMHDKMYGAQDKLDEASLKEAASSLGLDAAKLDACLGSGRAAAEVEEDFKKAGELGVEGTPTFFVNGRQHLGAPTLEGLSAAIDAELE